MRKTKIICTIGPASENEEMLEKLILEGMNVARLNFSHGSYDEHLKRMDLIKKLNKKLGTFCATMVDTKGPEIRLGDMGDGVSFSKGDIVNVTWENVKGSKTQFQLNQKELFDDVSIGTKILMDDGKISMEVIEKKEDKTLNCEILNDGILTTKKSANVPNVKLSMPFLSEKDEEDIRFACKNDVDFIALSFVRRRSDIESVRKILAEEGAYNIELISKIENQEGYDNLEDILEASDGIMVARGDLGVEVPYSLVPIYQKKIIEACNKVGKPVITATHMLESMINNPRSTRAEASDIANAVLDGSDLLMLSGETASGKYPIESLKTMIEIIIKAEGMVDFRKFASQSSLLSHRTKNEAIGIAVAESCLTLNNVCCVVAFTETGGTARRIARFRPIAPVFALTNSKKTARKMALYYGIYPRLISDISNFDFYDVEAQKVARSLNYAKGSTMITTSGYNVSHGTTNTIRFLDVE